MVAKPDRTAFFANYFRIGGDSTVTIWQRGQQWPLRPAQEDHVQFTYKLKLNERLRPKCSTSLPIRPWVPQNFLPKTQHLLLTFDRSSRTIFLQDVDGTAMSSNQTNLLQGTLDLLILKSLKTGELHGLGVSRRIDQITRGTFQVKPGSLFPALHRLEEAGWLTSFWGESENNRRARFYRLTKAGERQFGQETEQWQKIVSAMTNALKAT